MRKRPEPDLAAECREMFLHYCHLYRAASYHADKRKYADAAYEQVDIYLDLRDLDAL